MIEIVGEPIPGVMLGCLAGIFDAITNGTLTMSATKELFKPRPLLWVATLVAFFTVGMSSALPFVAATMQSTDTINNATGIDIRFLKPIFGNTSLSLYGALNSIGIAGLLVNLISMIRAKYYGSKLDQYLQIKRYLEDQRSAEEYIRFIESPTLLYLNR